ncbi:hypothetical protein [Aureibacter tunicatorum]|uniref:Uncharacterized protein n=1 Tax=Aureibacter tunicatorum TaxID=866807 RepID=A0AAE3XLY7_9BACT|nr:hypothetical protein [Aureibacter tunicatorum]MDR6238448.1 hypothetical protein [Aureibacter tunicatorum]BDD05618.1 hypothetical protein AUTU_31010 [Aureibacter tunicatorum]
MKINIPEQFLPHTTANPNSLVTTYNTNVLYPKLGPLAVSRHIRVIARILKDYAAAASLLGKERDYRISFKTPVKVIKQPDEWIKDKIVFKPLLEVDDPYMKNFIADLAEFRDPVVAAEVIGDKVKGSQNDPKVGGNVMIETPVLRPGMINDGATVINNLRAVSDTMLGGVSVSNRRLTATAIKPETLITVDPEILKKLSEKSTSDADKKSILERAMTQKKAYMLGNIMHGLSQTNLVVEDMTKIGLLKTEGQLVSNTLISSKNYLDTLATKLSEKLRVDPTRLTVIGSLIDQAFEYLKALGMQSNDMIRRYESNRTFRARVQKYVLSKMDTTKPIDNKLTPLPDDSSITKSREWAFQRVETLTLNLQKPVLRGPFSAETVAPNSELTISESFTSESFQLSESASRSANSQSVENGVFSSVKFKAALNNMTESGITDENSFSKDSTLFNTLRERRRDSINKTLTNISNENENKDIRGSRIVTSTSRSYTTRGKDENHATTELSFQVTTPVDVKVKLEDVNLVWAPQVASPFLELHRNIRRQYVLDRRDYITQNYVVDPMRPAEVYETQTIKKELGIRGRNRYQSRSFEFPIDAKYHTEGWELDLAATTIDFRNGNSGDYNWDERGNWDDLENHDTSFKSIYQEGNMIKGEAVLETTDPEYFNRGFFVFKFSMRRMTENSKAELKEYANQKQAAEAERRAVHSRANQYARLKRQELIQRYENGLDLQEEAFNALISQVFQGENEEHYGYYKEIIRSSINWEEAAMHFETNTAKQVPFAEYGRMHFMNAEGIRFILPVIRGAEAAFYEAIGQNGSDYYKKSTQKVMQYTNAYRDRVEELKVIDPEALVLDEYSREVVIGKHLEAVVSEHSFTVE